MMQKLFTGILLLACTCLQALGQDSKDFVLGKILRLHSSILNEDRTLNIYLPEGYHADSSYPVIYLLDGGADEDFIHVAGLVQFNTFEWINRIPKSIVVGIANTNRKRDFTFPTTIEHDKKMVPVNGGSAEFISFIEKELQPFVNNKYKTNGAKTLIGQSLGGLLATEILFTKPGLFDKYIIISPSLWWDDGSMLKRSLPLISSAAAVYIGVGKEGSFDGKHVMEEDAKKLAEKIRTANLKNVNVYFDYLPEEDHATAGHPALFNAFRLLYPKKAED